MFAQRIRATAAIVIGISNTVNISSFCTSQASTEKNSLSLNSCNQKFDSIRQNQSYLFDRANDNIIATSSASSNTKNIKMFIQEISSFLNLDQIETEVEELKMRGKPWNSYHKILNSPDVILFPQSTQDVSAIVKLCLKYNICIVPYGGGTSLEGQLLAINGGVSLDFSRMKSVLELNEEDLDVKVQAGLGYIELNEFLRSKGLWFPLDPGPGATIGGMVSCRCSGSTAVKYGSMRENVLNLTAVLPDGSIIKTGSRARKSSAGYDITRLLIGAEGTLAVITEATLKIHCIPKVSYAMRISFPNKNGVFNAATTAKETLTCGVTIGRCELLDDFMVKIINQVNPSDPNPWPENVTLMYEITGLSAESVNEQIEIVSNIAKKNNGTNILIVKDPEETKRFWMMRKECLWSAMSVYPDREPMITDVCVPLSKLPDLITNTKIKIDESSLPCPIVAHAVKQAKKLATEMAESAILMGGTCTGEHGVGVGKKELLKLEIGENTIKLMQKIKSTIDPENILNPDKIIDFDNYKK
eukprot:gene7430-10126_t